MDYDTSASALQLTINCRGCSNAQLSIFVFGGQQVRFVGTDDKPEWIAQDVGDVLDVGFASSTLRNFELDGKALYSVHTPGEEQSMLSLTEADLYRLVFKSRKPVAERFRRWVFQKVILSICQTGNYSLQDAEIKRMKLKLELIKAKQHYQDSDYAIGLSTSAAILQWLLGEASPKKDIEYRDRFINGTGKEIISKKRVITSFSRLRDHSFTALK